MVRVSLLGQLDVCVDGAGSLALGSARVESLIAYLLLHRAAPVSRDRLAFLLWPDSAEPQARTNLRHVLHTLRQVLPEVDRYVEITARAVRWRPGDHTWVDIAAHEQLLTTRHSDDEVRRKALQAAIDLYTGDLLEGRDDEWLRAERDQLRRRHLDALAELAELCETAGDTAAAIGHAERLLRGDPLREETYRMLMRLRDAGGDKAGALRVYHLCSSTLHRELGVEPSVPTRAAYEALLASDVDAPKGIGRPALVGRGPERARLVAAWHAADAGAARFVLVTGEPGIGKSRLVEEFRTWCSHNGTATAEARCYAAEGPLAYGPVVDWLRSAALRPRRSRLDRTQLTELARLLPELLVERPGLDPPQPLPANDQRHRLFAAVAAAVLSAGGPLVLVLDDLQHADPETCQLLHYLLRIAPAARLLVVATARGEDIEDRDPFAELLAGLRRRERIEEMELSRLGSRETALLAERLSGRPFQPSDAELLHRETDGNPLYIVEAVRAGWAPGQPPSPRVQSVIEDRLAQLSDPARELIGVAATVGREFSTAVLAAVTRSAEEALVRGLDELWRRRLISEQSIGTYGTSYDFTHDRIRQVAYLDVTPARRRMVHRQVAEALERANAGALGPVSAQIAAHHEHAGAAEQAITWYRRAAAEAQLLQANAAAVRLLDRALALIAGLPHSRERDVRELELRAAVVGPLVPVHGYASPALSTNQQRALQLADALGIEPAPPLLRSLALRALTRADFPAATRFGQRLHAAGEQRGDHILIVEGAYVLGVSAFWQADLAPARRHFEEAVEHYRPQDRTEHLVRYAQDPRVVCLSRLANTLWFLGSTDAAVAARDAALASAGEIAHPFSRSVAVVFCAMLALDMGEHSVLRDFTVELQARGNEVLHHDIAAGFGGYVDVIDGEVERGMAAIRAAIEQTRQHPTAPGQHAMLGRVLLAACVSTGDTASILDAADRLIEEGGPARLWAPVAHRVRNGLTRRG